MSDLGVMFDEKLTFKEHARINKAYMMLGINQATGYASSIFGACPNFPSQDKLGGLCKEGHPA